MDEPYYVQFNVSGQAIGLDPHGHKSGAVVYFHVTDIKSTLRALHRRPPHGLPGSTAPVTSRRW